MEKILELWDQGYSAIDVVVTIFRVVKASDKMPEYTKLEFIKVRTAASPFLTCERVERVTGNRVDSYAGPGRCWDPGSTGWAGGPPL